MSFLRHASFEILASGYADAQGSVSADVSRVGGTGTAFTKSAHRHEFVYDPKPGYLYVRSRAISSRTNDNFDTFPAHAIEAAWSTFIGKPVFVNHHNSNHRRMRGVIIDAALHKDTAPDGSPDTWTEVLMEVDAVRFPKLAEAVVKGWIDRTSMGTEVALSTCSFCGNQAANPTEYCRHIPAMKGQRIIRTQGSTREAVLISEICEGLHFFENSLLVEAPADPTAFTFGLDTRGLAAEKATAHLVKAATRLDPKQAALVAIEVEALAAEAAEDFSDFEYIEAEAILSKEASMCSECNPDLKAAGVTAMCAPHAYQVKARANVGRSSGDALGQSTAAIDGTGPCGGYGCDCQSYRPKGKIGSYDTCECGHSQNVHSGGEQKGGGVDTTQPQKTKRATKTALGEQRAPAQVDTLRMDACPVCGDDDGFDGNRCRVCQFVKPPAMFDDPNVEKAKQVDLRGGDVDEAEGGTAAADQLQCDSCGKTYPLDNEPKATDTTKPGAGKANPPVAEPTKPKAPATSTTSAFNPDPDEVQQGVQPQSGFGEEEQDADAAPKADGPLADGSTCPSCGTGTLHAAPAAADATDATGPDAGPQGLSEDVPVGDGATDPAVQDSLEQAKDGQPVPDGTDVDPEQGEPGTEPGQQDPADNPVHPDHGAPANPAVDAPDQTKPEDDAAPADEADEDGDDEDKKSPPWLKKKKAFVHRALAELSKESVDMPESNPAQAGRNRLIEAIRTQQSMITTQAGQITDLQRGLLTLATAAGVGSHPHFASLVTAADEEKDPVATTDEQALKPAAKDDPESIGAAPAAANTGVTPDGTTDVGNTNVTLPTQPLNNLVDVTAPVGGTDVPKGDAAHVETDVKYKAPSNEPFPDNSGWKKSSLDEDPQVRFMASLRLAEFRKSAGLAEGENVTVAQSINDDTTLSLALIQHEINTLASLAGRVAPTQQVQASRATVPQRAEVPRTMPSLSAQASGGVVPVGSSASGVASAQMRDSLL